ncbi:hypothetical protein FJY63_14855, partial [Candidatus Sumerlaeota bacterium]|nr:hypothetical protein [Candidatus Sumerlaeota bacterium]
LLVTAFTGGRGKATLVALNRSTMPMIVHLSWPKVAFREMEIADQYRQNELQPEGFSSRGGTIKLQIEKLQIEPGAIVTLTNVELGGVKQNKGSD